MCAAALVDVAITESTGYVVDKLRNLKAFQLSIAAMLWD
jgi:hypothetical protein